MSHPTNLDQLGFCYLRDILALEDLSQASKQIDLLLSSDHPGILKSRGVGYGVRNLLKHWPDVAQLVNRSPPVLEFLRETVGPMAGIVRGLVFDKPADRSWSLPWHRDRTIAIQSTTQLPAGFRSPTFKAGVMHVNAPIALLETMLTLRFSIDPMNSENGQLCVLPASHLTTSGGDQDLEIDAKPSLSPIECRAGDVFAMRPLLAHCSGQSSPGTKLRRRVIHLEICPDAQLPQDLQWQDYLPIEYE